MSKEKRNINTLCIHGGPPPEPQFGSVMYPVHFTSTYAQDEPGKPKVYDYARGGNPTRDALEQALRSLEGGTRALAFSSGMSAITTTVSLLKKGDHIISCDDVYGGTFRLFTRILNKFGIESSFVDMTNLDNLRAAIKPNSKMLWIETPSNPLLRVVDIKAATEIAKQHQLLSVVDNTFMSPYFQQPLQLGADIVMHSTTKYLNGHSDIIGGALVVADQDLGERLHFLQYSMGTSQSPMDAWLVLRGIKTLAVRMQRHEENALQLATFLEEHPKVKRVTYPGLKSHPQHEIARKQMRGFGGMISFEIDGNLKDAKKFLQATRCFILAESLGGVESLVEHPAIMTHASVPKDVREAKGISDTLIRVSVGIEHVDDLKRDLDQALA